MTAPKDAGLSPWLRIGWLPALTVLLLVVPGAGGAVLSGVFGALGGYLGAAMLLTVALLWVLGTCASILRRIRGRTRVARPTRTCVLGLACLLLVTMVVLPATLAVLATGQVTTRGDERAWPGPRIAVDGTWQPWTREELKIAEEDGTLPPSSPHAVQLRAEDGVPLRAFLVPPLPGPGKGLGVVLVHGFFRNGMETAPVAAMWRRMGAEVLQLELRNHGGSGRAPFGAGVTEARDVRAAIAHLSKRSPRGVILWGVSLGAGASLYGAEGNESLVGLFLDCPLTDASASAGRMLGRSDRLAVPSWLHPWILRWMGWVGGVDLASVRPGQVAPRLNPAWTCQIAAAREDALMPLEEVRRWAETLASPPERRPFTVFEADHGGNWEADPRGYEELVRRFVTTLGR